jgi:hypothetical protein
MKKNLYCIIFVVKDKNTPDLNLINEKIKKLFDMKNISVLKNNFFINSENKNGYINCSFEDPTIKNNLFLEFLKKNLADYNLIIRIIKIKDIEKFLFDIK